LLAGGGEASAGKRWHEEVVGSAQQRLLHAVNPIWGGGEEEAHRARLPAAARGRPKVAPVRSRCAGGDRDLSGRRGAPGRCGSRGGGGGSSQRPEEAAVGGASTVEGEQGAQLTALAVTSRRLAARGQHARGTLGGARGGHIGGLRRRRDDVQSGGARWRETA
jgi:hypothetical protein